MRLIFLISAVIAQKTCPGDHNPCYDGVLNKECEQDCVRWCSEQGDPGNFSKKLFFRNE